MQTKWFVLCLMGLTALVQAQEWKLVWCDEFDGQGLPDSSKWNYEQGFIRNNEAQYYLAARPENARVENGLLIIEARKEKWANSDYQAGAVDGRAKQPFAEYTSASLITSGKAAWTHGRIEVKAKLPTGRGLWPAIWLLGEGIQKVGWPLCGEIDIMENVGFAPDTIHANIHTKKYNHVLGTNKGAKIRIEKPHTAFHVYAVEWTPDRMDFFVDAQKYFTYENEGSGVEAWPFDQPHYLILNIAIGGAWGGQKGIDTRVFPQQMQVDYVRVYEK